MSTALMAVCVALLPFGTGQSENEPNSLERDYQTAIKPLLEQYCYDCHAEDVTEADIDLGKFRAIADVRRQTKIWQKVREIIDSGQMPPKEATQPSDAERTQLRKWVRDVLAREAKVRAGDPGPVVLRRLNNAEYTYTIRDLTGLDSLNPTREFPVDGAAGEGFTNVGSGQGMSPALIQKYLGAAKQIAEHAVLVPDGIRFSTHTTRRDQTDELMARIQSFYRQFTEEGGGSPVNLQGIQFDTNQGGLLPLEKYLTATLSERDSLTGGEKTIDEVAQQRSLNARYLATLWKTLAKNSGERPSLLIDSLREKWRRAKVEDAAALTADIASTQKALWKFNRVGQIGREGGPPSWLEAVSPITTQQQERHVEEAMKEFRELFPPALCYTRLVPVDEVVTLTLFHREDDHLKRLMLSEQQAAQLDRLWDELIFVSREPIALTVVFEQLAEFATQDRPDLVKAFAPLEKPIDDRADAFRRREVEAEPSHVHAILELARRAWRHPLTEPEREDLHHLYQHLRESEIPHEQAVRLTLARVLTSPAFLYKLEQPAHGKDAVAVSDVELATRLSYFLWSSLPDEQLDAAAAAGRLTGGTDSDGQRELVRQTRRMLADPRTQRLAIQFACQWLHVRDFDRNDDKNEKLYPQFAELRHDMYEETVRFFEDMFRDDGSILDILNADHTFLNESLATHYGIEGYGIEGISGNDWRRVDGVREHGRGGILAMATFLAGQSGASRTSPILRGNWVYETLLGERLPRPPANVPQLPDTVPSGLTARQLIERHSSAPECATCHVRVDPYGFALEQYDAIGRLRPQKVDTNTTLFDGGNIEGIDGLRDYLASERRDDVVRQFCRKLLGYALGREVQLSDEVLLKHMQDKLEPNGYRFSIAVETIVMSKQFREIRGTSFNP